MIAITLIEEIEGILILMNKKPSNTTLKALEQVDDIMLTEMRDDLAEEFYELTGKRVLTL